MMDEKTNKDHPEGCRCMMCQGRYMYCGGRHHWIRLIVKLVIILIVFCIGVKVGEWKTALSYSWGYPGGYGNVRYMMGGGNVVPQGYGPGMMGWYWPSATSTQK